MGPEPLFGSAGGGDRTKSGSRRSTRAVYPASELSGEIILLLLLYDCIVFLLKSDERYSTLAVRPSVSVSGFEPSSTLRMGLLLYAQGVTDRWQRMQGQKCKRTVVGTPTCTVYPT